jgi:hypothetical protein
MMIKAQDKLQTALQVEQQEALWYLSCLFFLIDVAFFDIFNIPSKM